MKDKQDFFKLKKFTVNKVFVNKTTGQWFCALPKNRLKKFKIPPKRLEIVGLWERI